jgi:hypothetical protein
MQRLKHGKATVRLDGCRNLRRYQHASQALEEAFKLIGQGKAGPCAESSFSRNVDPQLSISGSVRLQIYANDGERNAKEFRIIKAQCGPRTVGTVASFDL